MAIALALSPVRTDGVECGNLLSYDDSWVCEDADVTGRRFVAIALAVTGVTALVSALSKEADDAINDWLSRATGRRYWGYRDDEGEDE